MTTKEIAVDNMFSEIVLNIDKAAYVANSININGIRISF